MQPGAGRAALRPAGKLTWEQVLFDATQRSGRKAFEWIEAVFSDIFGQRWNPFFHLGALSYFFFWIITVSGLYLYAFFRTGTSVAYESVEYLTNEQWYLGGIMRSLHRYASDAFVVTITLHLLREFFIGRFRSFRWFSWLSGVPLLWLTFIAGIGGYWLVWDKLAQYIAVSTAEWLDWLPFFKEPMARNFLDQETLSDRFFSLLSFIHIAVPLFLLLGMWIHIQRITRAKTNPPKGLAIGTFTALMVLSLVWPAVSQGPANLDVAAATVGLDWFYLNVYPLLDIWSPGAVWALLAGITLVLAFLPLLPPLFKEPAAVVDLGNCNGCGRCFEDCPFGAVVMQDRTDGLPFAQEAVVDPDLCAGCGICTGACPTATPFRRATALVPGIDMPALTVREIRDKTLQAAGALQGNDRVIVYGCRHGAEIDKLQGSGVAVLTLPCIAALPPSFLDFVIVRNHADGVFLTGCQECDCYYRLGIEWMEQRIAGKRDPYLRKKVPRERIDRYWAGPVGLGRLKPRLAAFRARLRELEPRQKATGPDTGIAQPSMRQGGGS